MNFLLMIILPWAIAAGGAVARPQTRLGLYGGLATLAVELIFMLGLPTNQPVRSLGVTFGADVPAQIVIGAVLLAFGTVLVIWTAQPPATAAPPVVLLVLGLAIGALLLQSTVPAALLLLMATGIATALLVDVQPDRNALLTPRVLSTAVVRLVLVLLGAVLLVMGSLLVPADAGWSFGTLLLWSGLALWVGLVPFHFSLTGLADDTPPTTMLCLVVLQTLVLALFGRIVGAVTDTAQVGLLVVAALTIVAAPVLARGTVRRAIAFVLVANTGQIVLGWAVGVGIEAGAWLVAAHIAAATLLLSSLALLEAYVPGSEDAREPWRQRPIAAAGLVAGFLLLLGMPLTGGFGPKLALWLAAWNAGPFTTILLVVGTLLLILAIVRVVRTVLFASAEQREADRREHWRRRVTPKGEEGSDVAALPVTLAPYAPVTVRAWTVVLIVVAVAAAIDMLFPS